jgi:hypothetical protein
LLQIKLPLPSIVTAIGRVIQGAGFRLLIPATQLPTIEEQEERNKEEGTIDEERGVSVTGEDEDDSKQGRHTFCPALYHDTIINMMERHYCAHPLIPGYSPPDAKLIKKMGGSVYVRLLFETQATRSVGLPLGELVP